MENKVEMLKITNLCLIFSPNPSDITRTGENKLDVSWEFQYISKFSTQKISKMYENRSYFTLRLLSSRTDVYYASFE